MDSNTEYSIFLHIIEGIGLNDSNHEITLTATLNGVKFEVPGHHTETTTVFDSNCIWECQFDDLKRMKTDNRPIKIECFSKTQTKDKEAKKLIGFVLLPLRGLQSVKTLRNLQIKLHWYKLCGLGAEWRKARPEIYLSAIITTKELMAAGQFEEFLEPKLPNSSESNSNRTLETSSMLKSKLGIYVKLLEDECVLQVGNSERDCNKFVMTLTLKNAKCLDQLVDVGENKTPVFRFHYEFLGGASDLVLIPNSDGVYNIHEKISVNFKSSLESLKDYFSRVFYIPVELYYNDSIVGNYNFKCADLMPSSMDAFSGANVWEVIESFELQTLFGHLDSSVRPIVNFMFSLNHSPDPSRLKSPVQALALIDKKARGDVKDDNDFLELPPTILSTRTEKSEVLSATDRTNREPQKIPKISRSASALSKHSSENPGPVENEIPPQLPENDIAYQIIAELEDWKCQQMDEFLHELKRKEIYHLDQLSVEWKHQKADLMQGLQEKLNECAHLTESLEAAHKAVREKTKKLFDDERELEKTRHELDKSYTVRFMEIEEKARRIQDQMDYELKLQELRFKELQMQKDCVNEENVRLQSQVEHLGKEIEEMRKNFLPKQQLEGLFEDLRQQMERYYEMEKSKKFYKEQWVKAAKELHKLKMQSLKAQEQKILSTTSIGADNITALRNLIFGEQEALHSDRCELKTVKEALASESDDSKSSYES